MVHNEEFPIPDYNEELRKVKRVIKECKKTLTLVKVEEIPYFSKVLERELDAILDGNLKEGTREHALFLTYVISIDYMTDAVKLWKRSRDTYELYPERFTPEEILKISPRTVENTVKNLGARFYSNAAKTWIKISKLLVDKYGGDPRNIAREPLEIVEIKRRLKEFPYLRGNKLSNFYMRVMGETGLFKVKNLDELDIPVDKQVARFTMYTGVVRLLSAQFTGCVHEEP